MTDKSELETFLKFQKDFVYAWLEEEPSLELLQKANTEIAAVANAVDRRTFKPIPLPTNLQRANRDELFKARELAIGAQDAFKRQIKTCSAEMNHFRALVAAIDKELG